MLIPWIENNANRNGGSFDSSSFSKYQGSRSRVLNFNLKRSRFFQDNVLERLGPVKNVCQSVHQKRRYLLNFVATGRNKGSFLSSFDRNPLTQLKESTQENPCSWLVGIIRFIYLCLLNVGMDFESSSQRKYDIGSKIRMFVYHMFLKFASAGLHGIPY